MTWADATIWSAVSSRLPSDARLRQLLVHLHVVQRAFHAMWTGGDARAVVRQADDFPTLADLRSWARDCSTEAWRFVHGVAPARLDERLELPWAGQLSAQRGRTAGPTTLGETCFQVASHSTYHRGQINLRLREIGGTPPLVDYIAWIWFGRPAAEWES